MDSILRLFNDRWHERGSAADCGAWIVRTA
jgi:hypothetical protein